MYCRSRSWSQCQCEEVSDCVDEKFAESYDRDQGKRNLLGSFYFFSSNSSFLLFPLIFLSLTIIFRYSFIFFFYSIFMFLCFIFLCYFFLISFLFSLSSIPEVLPSLCFPFSFCSSYIFSSTVILIFIFSLYSLPFHSALVLYFSWPVASTSASFVSRSNWFASLTLLYFLAIS